MSDMPNIVGSVTSASDVPAKTGAFSVDETYWGYIIHKTGRPSLTIVALQVLCMFFGAAFLAAGLGLLLLPDVMSTSVDIAMRAGAAVLFFAFAAYLLWFASRGTESEVQVDNALGEVREVVRNRAGKSTLLGRYGYDAIGGVFLDRSGSSQGQATLMLRYRNTAQTMPVVSGSVDELSPLLTRLGRDLMMDVTPRRVEKTIAPRRLRA